MTCSLQCPGPLPTRTRLPGEEHLPEAVAAYQTQSHCTPRKDAEYNGWKSCPGLCWQMAIAQSGREKENPGLLLMLLFFGTFDVHRRDRRALL